MLRWPKELADNPNLDALAARLTAVRQPLGDGGEARAAVLPLDEVMSRALRAALGTGHLAQGLESISQTLAREAKGLEALRAKTGQEQAPRLSRLLLLANDGSERFYRDAARLLTQHSTRLDAIRLTTTSADLGAFTPKGNPTKALLIDDRKILALFLRVLSEPS